MTEMKKSAERKLQELKQEQQRVSNAYTHLPTSLDAGRTLVS
jgi:hypothetical protein